MRMWLNDVQLQELIANMDELSDVECSHSDDEYLPPDDVEAVPSV